MTDADRTRGVAVDVKKYLVVGGIVDGRRVSAREVMEGHGLPEDECDLADGSDVAAQAARAGFDGRKVVYPDRDKLGEGRKRAGEGRRDTTTQAPPAAAVDDNPPPTRRPRGQETPQPKTDGE